MSLAIIAALCLSFAGSPGTPLHSLPFAAAVAREQQTELSQAPSQDQAAQQPSGPAGQSNSGAQATQPPAQSATPDQAPPSQPSTPAPATQQQPDASSAPQNPAPAKTEEPQANPPQPQAAPQAAPAAPAKPAGKKPTRRPAAKKKSAAKTRQTPGPSKVVISNGGTSDPQVQLSPSVSKQQANAALKNTNQLLDATDANLKKLSGRQLSSAQQDMVKQIRSYMLQARTAVAGGDVQQATNLATKARMLSDEMVK